MERVVITLHGKQAIVDADQVKLLKKKEALVNDAVQNKVNNSAEIIKLNRRIRRTVQFI